MVARHWLFRASIAGNVFVLFYFAVYYTKNLVPLTSIHLNSSQPWRRHNTKPGMSYNGSTVPIDVRASEIGSSQLPLYKKDLLENVSVQMQLKLHENEAEKKKHLHSYTLFHDGDFDSVLNKKLTLQETPASREAAHVNPELQEVSKYPEENIHNLDSEIPRLTQGGQYDIEISEVVKLFPCDDYTPHTYFSQRGPFWVLHNYVTPRKHFKCDESITYTTHADFTFLDNLIPLLQRWDGPVSLAIYSPGTDFNNTIKRITYLRECVNNSSLVKDYVSFHLFFDYKHTPKHKIPTNPGDVVVNCSIFKDTDVGFGENYSTYRKQWKLPYPVNVARNVAREMSMTHHILPSDIELYPSPNLIPDFLDMIRRNDTPELRRPNPNKVYVLSIFEIESNVTGMPHDKSELVHMLRNRSAIPFHKYVCANCHRIPKAKEWVEFPIFPGLNIFHVGKRYKPYHHWEPIFIGTKHDPVYDERLTWEGRSDKMTQGYILCVLDYEFHILDNAFLIHRPGIKRIVTIPSKTPVVSRQNTVIAKVILPELKQLFGTKSGCYV